MCCFYFFVYLFVCLFACLLIGLFICLFGQMNDVTTNIARALKPENKTDIFTDNHDIGIFVVHSLFLVSIQLYNAMY